MLQYMLINVENQFRSMLPHDNGLLLRPVGTHRIATAKKVCRKYRTLQLKSLYRSLPLHHNSKKNKSGDWRFKNRVGKRADEWRKACNSIYYTLVYY